MTNRYKKLFSNTIIFTVGTFASKVLVFLMMPLYTSFLSPEMYGTSDIITQTANLLIPLACIGICDGMYRFALDNDADRRAVFSTGIVILLLTSSAFLALSPLFMLFEIFDGYVWLIVVYVLCANFHSAAAQYVRAVDRTKLFAGQGILGTLLTILLNILFLVVFKMGVAGYVLSVVLADFAVTVFLVIYAKLYKETDYKKFDPKIAGKMLRYSIPLIPTTLFWWITNVSDRYFVKGICGDTVNGLYSAAYKIPTLITLVSSCFIEAWKISSVKDSDDSDRSDFFAKVFEGYQGILFITCSGIILFTKPFTKILFAADYFASWEYIPMLVVATVFASLVTFMGTVYQVYKKSLMTALTALLGGVLNIILNIILIPMMGAFGAALATFTAYLAAYVLRAVTSRKYVRFRLYTVRIIINTAIVLIQTAVIGYEVKGWVFIEIVAFAAIAILNGRALIKAARQIFSGIFSRRTR